MSFMSNKHTRAHMPAPFLYSERALGGQASRDWEKGKRTESATEDVRLYLTYSSFEICWCAPSQLSQDSSRLDEKHFYWAFWEGQLPLCGYVCVCKKKQIVMWLCKGWNQCHFECNIRHNRRRNWHHGCIIFTLLFHKEDLILRQLRCLTHKLCANCAPIIHVS